MAKSQHNRWVSKQINQLADLHKPHDGMCDLKDQVCKAYIIRQAANEDSRFTSGASRAKDSAADSRRARLHRALDCVLDRSAAARGRDEEQYVVFCTGGSIGEHPWQSTPLSQVDAKAKAKRMNASLSPGEKQYYKIKYCVKKA